MKRFLCYLVIGATLLSLCSCGSMGRSFGRMMGQPTPVYH